ncbi:MAG: hypothetical protein K9I94_03375 [Bacteroidales bacterium]|nr:hypothetical protein [Bacteroidales bacterium]
MKRIKKITAILSIVGLLAFSPVSLAQVPPHPDNEGIGGGTGNGDPLGGAAPIGSGIALIITLGAGYGARKVYNARKKKLME